MTPTAHNLGWLLGAPATALIHWGTDRSKMLSVFKAYDIRGVWGEALSPELVYCIGRGMSTMLRRHAQRPSAVVGGDVRTSTEAVRALLLKGLTDGGCEVIDVGVVPTPVFYHAVRAFDPDGSAMITASHNPPEFNGLKVSLDRGPITPEKLQELRAVVEAEEFSEGAGQAQRRDVWAAYHAFLAEEFPSPFRLKVVADAGNGAWSAGVADTLDRLGFDVVPLFCEPDGSFPNRPPDPSKAKNLEALRRKVKAEAADLGVAFDGDGDRAAFVDEHGEPVDRDKIVIALARDALARCDDPAGESVVFDMSCSKLVSQAVREAGATPLMERIGYTFIRERVLRENALFGAELSGHFFYRRLHALDDGMYSFLRCARMAQDAGMPLSALLGAIPTLAATPMLRLPCDEQEGAKLIDAIAAAAEGPYEVSRLDGVRVDAPDGWGLVRMSATEPLICVRFEADAPDRLPGLVDELLAPAPELRDRVAAELGWRGGAKK